MNLPYLTEDISDIQDIIFGKFYEPDLIQHRT